MGMPAFELVTKVVVVEDDPTFLSFWGRILSDIGVKDYELFSDPIKACAMLREVSCCLLISDIIMPKMNGYELAKVVRNLRPGSNVLLTTAYGTDLSRFNLSDCHFHLLHKPYTDIAALKRFVMHLINGDPSFDDLAEESSSENEDYPQVTEWKL